MFCLLPSEVRRPPRCGPTEPRLFAVQSYSASRERGRLSFIRENARSISTLRVHPHLPSDCSSERLRDVNHVVLDIRSNASWASAALASDGTVFVAPRRLAISGY